MTEVVQSSVSGVVQIVTINRPEARNALNGEVLATLTKIFDPKTLPSGVAATILMGAGDKAFVAGADIREMVQAGGAGIKEYVAAGQRVMRLIEEYPVPVIASVQGFALGGGMELALACDLIVASSAAQFGQPEVNLGIIPGFGGTQRLLERCGIGATRKLVYTGQIISAAEALRLGAVDEVVAPEELQAATKKLAELIATKGPLAVRMAKRVIRGAHQELLNTGLKREVEGFVELFGTADREEGMRAFTEKRPAKFTGR
jgi:enoyl-CoA hydratase